jgi:predicted kinase
MRFVEILKGLPASGKSTYSKDKVENSKCGIVRVNKDDLRAMLHNSKHTKGNENFVLLMRDLIILEALHGGKSVIVDDTNFNPKHEGDIRAIVKAFNIGHEVKNTVQVRVKYFDTEPEECIKRDLKRANSVGSHVIWDMYKKYVKKEKSDKDPYVLKQDPSLPHIVICDIDGTVALMKNHRGPFEYTKVDKDEANYEVIGRLEDYICNEEYNREVIFMSGREDSCTELTRKWLDNNVGIDATRKLYMRKTGDFRKDTVIKQELFEKEIKDKYYVDFVLDDRACVVNMWRELGLTCLQVADGNF